MFPAWVPLGKERPRGLDAMGQRLIMLGGTWFMLILVVAARRDRRRHRLVRVAPLGRLVASDTRRGDLHVDCRRRGAAGDRSDGSGLRTARSDGVERAETDRPSPVCD